jgi:hypothetical protein
MCLILGNIQIENLGFMERTMKKYENIQIKCKKCGRYVVTALYNGELDEPIEYYLDDDCDAEYEELGRDGEQDGDLEPIVSHLDLFCADTQYPLGDHRLCKGPLFPPKRGAVQPLLSAWFHRWECSLKVSNPDRSLGDQGRDHTLNRCKLRTGKTRESHIGDVAGMASIELFPD